MTTPEGKVKRQINEVLNKYEVKKIIYVYRPVPAGYGPSTLDYACCGAGRFFAIEAKRRGAKPTPRQELIIKWIKQAGGTVFVIDDENDTHKLEKYLEFIAKLSYQPKA